MLKNSRLPGLRSALSQVGAWLALAALAFGVSAQAPGPAEPIIVDVANWVLWKREGVVDVVGLVQNQTDDARTILGMEGTVVDRDGQPIATLEGEPLIPVVPGWHRVPFRAGGTVPESAYRIRWKIISEPVEGEPVVLPIESLTLTTRPPGIGGVVAEVTGTVALPEETRLQRVVVAVTLLDETGAPVAVASDEATGVGPGGSHAFTLLFPKLSPLDQGVYDVEFLALGWLPEGTGL